MAPTSCRELSFTLISASDLPDVRNFGRMKVYAKISLREGKSHWQTSVDEVNETNPEFNSRLKIMVPQSSMEEDPYRVLDIALYCERTFAEDKYVGQVNIPLKALFDFKPSGTHTVPVKVEDFNSTKGTIEFSWSFGELVTANIEEEKSSSALEILEVVAKVTKFTFEVVSKLTGH